MNAGVPERRLTVVKPGMLTTIQDLGRRGYQGLGVPVSGPMDAYSHRLANQLLGNDPSAAVLEVTLLGPELVAEGDLTCAATGADLSLTINGKPAPLNEPFRRPGVRGPREGTTVGKFFLFIVAVSIAILLATSIHIIKL